MVRTVSPTSYHDNCVMSVYGSAFDATLRRAAISATPSFTGLRGSLIYTIGNMEPDVSGVKNKDRAPLWQFTYRTSYDKDLTLSAGDILIVTSKKNYVTNGFTTFTGDEKYAVTFISEVFSHGAWRVLELQKVK